MLYPIQGMFGAWHDANRGEDHVIVLCDSDDPETERHERAKRARSLLIETVPLEERRLRVQKAKNYKMS